ncbi:MAG: holo-ACP synthase, partial [bacterium]
MIRGIGIDIVRTSRLDPWLNDEGLLARFFHPEELASVFGRGSDKVLSLAARFAAKEAFGKALGTGLMHFNLREVQVRNDELGKPDMVLYGRAREAFDAMGGVTAFVSLAHERDNAIA